MIYRERQGIIILKISIMAIAGLFAALMLKKDKPEYATLVILFISLFIAVECLGIYDEVISLINEWGTLVSENIFYIKLLLKLVGITYICEFASNMCKDAGYSALSNHIELFGKISVMIAGMPVLKTIMDMLNEILG